MKNINIAQRIKCLYLPGYPQGAEETEVQVDMIRNEKRLEICDANDDQNLREQSRHWSAGEWEAYLQTLDGDLKESLSSKPEVERKGSSANIFDLASPNASEDLARAVKDLLSVLSRRQAFVLKRIYWDGHTERRIAKTMGISRQAVYDLKKRALRKLKKHALGVLAKFPIVGTEESQDRELINTTGEDPAA